MKHGLIKTINLCLVVVLLFTYNIELKAQQSTWNLEPETEIVYVKAEQPVQTSQYSDGTYTGSAEGFGGPVEVQVIIEDGKIQDVEVLSAEQEDATFFAMAQEIIPNIVSNQSTDVDVASGATFSSNGIIGAVKAALEKAGAQSE